MMGSKPPMVVEVGVDGNVPVGVRVGLGVCVSGMEVGLGTVGRMVGLGADKVGSSGKVHGIAPQGVKEVPHDGGGTMVESTPGVTDGVGVGVDVSARATLLDRRSEITRRVAIKYFIGRSLTPL